jgi:hypothetical protein
MADCEAWGIKSHKQFRGLSPFDSRVGKKMRGTLSLAAVKALVIIRPRQKKVICSSEKKPCKHPCGNSIIYYLQPFLFRGS